MLRSSLLTPTLQLIRSFKLLFFHMEGKALSWYSWLMNSSPLKSWEEFVVALKTHFGPSAYEDPVGVFTKLQQTSTVEDYQSRFEVLSNRIIGLTEEFWINTFISGLREDLRITIFMFKPTTLFAAFGLARLQEEEMIRRSWGHETRNFSLNQSFQHQNHRLPAPIPILRLPPPPTKPDQRTINTNPRFLNATRKLTLPIRRISPTQMQQRRERGLCYYCDEKFHLGHKCNWLKLFLLEGMREGRERRGNWRNPSNYIASRRAERGRESVWVVRYFFTCHGMFIGH